MDGSSLSSGSTVIDWKVMADRLRRRSIDLKTGWKGFDFDGEGDDGDPAIFHEVVRLLASSGSQRKPRVSGQGFICLYQLFKVVRGLGGYHAVSEGKQWEDVAEKLKYEKGIGPALKQEYRERLLDFEGRLWGSASQGDDAAGKSSKGPITKEHRSSRSPSPVSPPPVGRGEKKPPPLFFHIKPYRLSNAFLRRNPPLPSLSGRSSPSSLPQPKTSPNRSPSPVRQRKKSSVPRYRSDKYRSQSPVKQTPKRSQLHLYDRFDRGRSPERKRSSRSRSRESKKSGMSSRFASATQDDGGWVRHRSKSGHKDEANIRERDLKIFSTQPHSVSEGKQKASSSKAREEDYYEKKRASREAAHTDDQMRYSSSGSYYRGTSMSEKRKREAEDHDYYKDDENKGYDRQLLKVKKKPHI